VEVGPWEAWPVPVEPKPPAPRSEQTENSSTIMKRGRTIGTNTIYAKRSPGISTIESDPAALRFQALTRTGPV